MPTTVVQTYTYQVGTIDLTQFCNCPSPCASCCGETTSCCPSTSIPNTIHINWTVGICNCGSSGSAALTWNGTDGWTGSFDPGSCSTTITVKFYCANAGPGSFQWRIDINGCAAANTIQQVTNQCSPLNVTFNAITIQGCCPGSFGSTITFTVTL